MNNYIKFSLYTFLFGLVFYNYLFMHEIVHKTIWEYDGVESKIQYDFGIPTSTKATGDYEKCSNTCELSHNINEIVGYQIDSFFYLLYIIGLFLIFNKNHSNPLQTP